MVQPCNVKSWIVILVMRSASFILRSRRDVFRTCLGKVGIAVFSKLDSFTLVKYLVWHLKSSKHDDCLLSKPYLRRGFILWCVEFADLGHVVLEIIPL